MQKTLQALTQSLSHTVEELFPAVAQALPAGALGFESPKVAAHGDLATSAAMLVAKAAKQPPRIVAQKLCDALQNVAAFQQAVQLPLEIAGPGFINLRLKPEIFSAVIHQILRDQDAYGHRAERREGPQKSMPQTASPPDEGERVLVEFVSANPTGPLHVGHARQAALGDTLCNLLQSQGYRVVREFYYNDAGVQIETLVQSVKLRAQGIKPGDASWPENAYHGEYIADIAADFLAGATVQSDDRSTTASGSLEQMDNLREFSVAWLRREQDLDLAAIGLRFDNFYLESSLYRDGRVAAVVDQLKAANCTYEQDGALWLKTTDFGDEKDRVMRKTDGSFTYFVPDIAYHQTKWERGFRRAINIQGMDHHGTIARVRAGLQALQMGLPRDYPDYILHTMVRVVKDGGEVKISKRAGSYVTLRDLISWTSRDALRFLLVSRKPESEYTFDVDLALQKNSDNPVYYVQYAHARICSILAQGADKAASSAASPTLQNLHALNTPAAHNLIRKLAEFPGMLDRACKEITPHDIPFYLRDLAGAVHAYYGQERVLDEDADIRCARLHLMRATAQVIKNGLSLLGVSAPESM